MSGDLVPGFGEVFGHVHWASVSRYKGSITKTKSKGDPSVYALNVGLTELSYWWPGRLSNGKRSGGCVLRMRQVELITRDKWQTFARTMTWTGFLWNSRSLQNFENFLRSFLYLVSLTNGFKGSGQEPLAPLFLKTYFYYSIPSTRPRTYNHPHSNRLAMSTTDLGEEHLRQTPLIGAKVNDILSRFDKWLEGARFEIADPEKSEKLLKCNDGGLNKACQPLLIELGIYKKVFMPGLFSIPGLHCPDPFTTPYIQCNTHTSIIYRTTAKFCRFRGLNSDSGHRGDANCIRASSITWVSYTYH